MERQGNCSGRSAFLWAGKRKAAWALLGVMLVLPSIAGAQLEANLSLLLSTKDGDAKIDTIYTSQFTNGKVGGIEQHQYLNEVYGKGGPVTALTQFKNNEDSEIALAGMSLLKGAQPQGAQTTLKALEKIGTGQQDLREFFVAAGGSMIRVTETLHTTQGATIGGNLSYGVESSGVGSIEVGLAGKFTRECVACKECSKGGAAIDMLVHSQLQMQETMGALKAGLQHFEMHADFSGQYQAIFEGKIVLPK